MSSKYMQMNNSTSLIYSTKATTKQLLQAYTAAKLRLSGLKAACIIPTHYRQALRDELKGWHQVHTLRRGEHKVNKHSHDFNLTEMEGKSDLHIYVDHQPESWAATTTYTPSSSTLHMTFKGKACGAQATIGLDTLAGGPGYVHPDFVKANRLHTRPCTAHITLGDGRTQLESTEECIMHISLGAYNCKAWLVVLAIHEAYNRA